MDITRFIAALEQVAPPELAEDYDAGRIGRIFRGRFQFSHELPEFAWQNQPLLKQLEKLVIADQGSRMGLRMEAGENGSVPGDGTHDCPSGFPVKANAQSRIYHPPGSSSYNQTIPEFCFATAEGAEAAGFRASRT